jgi:hypothetical protein
MTSLYPQILNLSRPLVEHSANIESLTASTVKNYIGGIKTLGELRFTKYFGRTELSVQTRELKKAHILNNDDLRKIATAKFNKGLTSRRFDSL